jgi:hypothetical protein
MGAMYACSMVRMCRVGIVVSLVALGLSVSTAAQAAPAIWQRSASPNPGGSNTLWGVASTSPTNAWAVGHYSGGTLVEHWNGKAWSVQPSPVDGAFAAVAATSSTNAWAVGVTFNRTLVEHWDGTAWEVQPSPNPPGFVEAIQLPNVAATSSTNAWAVGFYTRGGQYKTLIEHWNGKAWTIQHNPNPNPDRVSDRDLSGVAATSATNAWTVGSAGDKTLIEHWNGKAWRIQPSPNPRGFHNLLLFGVAAISSTNAWTVGYSQYGGKTLIEHWNGKAWRIQPSPSPRGYHDIELNAVAASSAHNVWAAGFYRNNARPKTLILHSG